MFEQLLIPAGAKLALRATTVTPTGVTFVLESTADETVCPTCHGSSNRVHSRYQRTLVDLPILQTPVTLQLRTRRFFCTQAACPRRTFSEQVPGLLATYARRTTRLSAEQRRLSLEIGAEPGARVAKRQGMPVSPDTLLRLARREPATPLPTPRVLGVDDFALRKGLVYGTILVDLERHQPVDLLPERSADALAQWLGAHPGVAVIARDRSAGYAEGSSRGAPDALQVADRFHLLQNLRDMLQHLLEQHPDALQTASGALAAALSTPAPTPEAPVSPASESQTLGRRSRAEQQRSQEWNERRRARYQRVKELRAQGLSLRVIAEQVDLSTRTVRRYGQTEQFPERVRPQRPSLLDPFRPYLEQRVAEGQDNALQLWRELREQYGYSGGWRQVARWLDRHRHLVPPPEPGSLPLRRNGRPPRAAPARPAAPPRLSTRRATWLLMGQPQALTEEEQGLVERLCGQAPALATAYELAQVFITMVRKRQGAKLDAWLAQAAASGVPELQRFGTGLERDKAAVQAALTLPYSNGQVEGQVNRLKLIKRMAYGRAKFDLLRQRVLARAP